MQGIHRIHNPFSSEKPAVIGRALDASGHVAEEPVDVAACIRATWIGGVADTVRLLQSSLCPGGTILIGEPFWRRRPPDQETVAACHAGSRADFLPPAGLIERFGSLPTRVTNLLAEYT
ncbi:hypothetical protein ABT187_29435 [Streptomyces sp. NPDC001817]|uniref:hypothetical protein n=1 Tax=Streptomyces sp. NPDC001817 TaxID=3154398 RepID=UPI00332C1E61